MYLEYIKQQSHNRVGSINRIEDKTNTSYSFSKENTLKTVFNKNSPKNERHSVLDDTVGLLHEVASMEDQKDTISALMEITLHLAK